MPLAGTGPEWSTEKVRRGVGERGTSSDTLPLFSLIDDAQDERTGPVPFSPCGCIIRMDEASEIRSLIKSTRAILARVGKGQK